jgi:lipid A 3-O-deacylase
MRLALAAALAASGAAILAPAASAQISSARFGVMKHNICVLDCKNADKESGVNIQAELRFDKAGWLSWLGSPYPYVMVSGNTDGNTSYAALGVEWDFELAEGWHFEPGLGYAMHDGTVNNPFPSGTQAAVDFSRDHVLLGSEDLFRTSLGLTWDFADDLGLQVIYEHLSHGQILGTGRNQGLDEIGVRLVWNFW